MIEPKGLGPNVIDDEQAVINLEDLMIETPVLVVGAGPVGLMTALELQTRGIKTLVVERNPSTTRHPKMDVTNGRSMEHFRRLGVAEQIRDVAVPRENCIDVSWVTRLAEWEVARFRYPNVNIQHEAMRARNDGSQPLEPYMRLSQVVLEPVMTALLNESEHVEILFGHKFERFEEYDDFVIAHVVTSDGEKKQICCQLLAGCDGGQSRVRAGLDIGWDGQFNIVPFYMVHYRTPERTKMQPFGVAWHYQSVVGGTLIAQDDDEIFTLHTILPEGANPDSVDPKQLLFQSLGVEFECEILQANPWAPHLVVANGYGRGRVWLAGDAVHQYIPTGGYGMNTGICDAVDLAWKFAATLQGWGGEKLLSSIEAERRPIGQANCHAAGENMTVRFKIAEAYDPIVHEDSEAGAQARKAWGETIIALGNAENESLGIELDYRYRASPIICHEGDEPAWDKLHYQVGTWPGKRAPHVFLASGAAMFDLFGPWFTLVRFDPSLDVSGLLDAAEQRGVPLKLLDIDDANARRIYERNLVLVRPDQHVCWRGGVAPNDPLALIDHIRGAGI